MTVRRALELLQVAVGAVLLYALVLKYFEFSPGPGGILHGPGALAAALRQHGIVPASGLTLIAYTVTVVEGIVSLVLLFAPSRASALSGLGLLLVYWAYLTMVYFKQGNVECGCFGRVWSETLVGALIRNAVLCAPLAISVLRDRDKPGTDAGISRPRTGWAW